MIALYIRELDIKGGTHKQFYYLADYLKRCNIPFKIITHTYHLSETYASFKELEDKIVCVRRKLSPNPLSKLYYYFLFLYQFRKELRGVRVLNIHDNGLQLLLPFLCDKQIIWQINDLPVEFRTGVNEQDKATLFGTIKQYYIKYACRLFVNKITVNVSKNKERIENAIGMPADVLYCGIEKLNIVRNAESSNTRFYKRQINLLSSGVFLPYRNYETSIKVVKNLVEKGYDVKLDIIGNTDVIPAYSNKIQQLINIEGLNDRVKILGQINEEKFAEVHKEADIFLFLNIDQSWGLAVFEAMSCGIPVIVSESVGATEILIDRQDAIFSNPVDVLNIISIIEELVNNKSFYKHFYNQGIAFSEKYSWDNSYSSKVSKLLQQYSK